LGVKKKDVGTGVGRTTRSGLTAEMESMAKPRASLAACVTKGCGTREN